MTSAELIEAQELAFVESIEICGDGFLTVCLRDFGFFTVQIPKHHKKFPSSFYGQTRSGELAPGSLRDMMQELYDQQAAISSLLQCRTESDALDDFPPQIDDDVAKFCHRFGNGAATRIPLMSMVWISMQIPVNGLISSTVAFAWGMRLDVPLTITLKFCGRQYVHEPSRPAVEVTQPGSESRILNQLARILMSYLEQIWPPTGFSPQRENRANVENASPEEAADADQSGRIKAVEPKMIGVPYLEEGGFLLHIADVAIARLPTMCDFCVLCHMPHNHLGLLQPTICSRDVCVFAFNELRISRDLSCEASVTQLLVRMFCAAVRSPREHILDPYPSVVDPSDPKVLAIDSKKKDIGALRKLISTLPKDTEGTPIFSADPLARSLVDWVVCSNRSHIVKMDSTRALASLSTWSQYVLITAAPEREAAFRKLKANHPTRFAFHGSPAENWHSILRNGLRSMTGTKDQLNGARYGKGIYFSPKASTSAAYCKQTAGQEDAAMMALCEIIDDGTTIADHGNVWTVQDDSKVMTRFFFCSNRALPAASSDSDSRSILFTTAVKSAMASYGLD